MAVITPTGMEGYEPPIIKGNCVVKVRDCKAVESGKGFQLFLDIVEGPKGQEWAEESIVLYVQTDFTNPEHSQWISGWKKKLYKIGQAFNVSVAPVDTDDFIGKEAIAVCGPDKEGDTTVKKWVIPG